MKIEVNQKWKRLSTGHVYTVEWVSTQKDQALLVSARGYGHVSSITALNLYYCLMQPERWRRMDSRNGALFSAGEYDSYEAAKEACLLFEVPVRLVTKEEWGDR